MKTQDKFWIYIADDDELFSESLKHMLDSKWQNTIKTKVFQTGEDLLKHISQEQPEIIILDYILNSRFPYAMDGSYVLQKLKQMYPEIKVIMLSGQSKIQIALDSIQNGAFDYIIKNDNVFLKTQNTVKKAMQVISDSEKTKKSLLILTAIALFAGATATSLLFVF